MSTFDKLLFAAKLAVEKPYRYTPASGSGYWVEDDWSSATYPGRTGPACSEQDLRMALTAEQVSEYERGR